MIILISPAKTLDFKFVAKDFIRASGLIFPKESDVLVKHLRKFSPKDLSELMNINTNLAQLNADRFIDWKFPFDKSARPALWAFRGEVFHGIEADLFTEQDYLFIKNHLRILSGLYGYLQIDTLIFPYRLEMGTRLKIGTKNNLYAYWSEKITRVLLEDLKIQDEKIILNLASNEYFKVLNTKKLNYRIISPEFKDFNQGEYKIVTIYAKKARGRMVQFITKNKITKAEDILGFDYDGYFYNPNMSTQDKPVFTRG